MSERWVKVPDFEDMYEISDMGNVRSLENGRLLHPNPDGEGYLKVELHSNGRRKTINVHRLVLSAFVGVGELGKITRHLNGDRTDNRLENLCYGTDSENNIDTVRHGRNKNHNKTQCKQGHPYDEKNTRIRFRDGTKRRECRKCNAIAVTKYKNAKEVKP